MKPLSVLSIFPSFDGECNVHGQGTPTVFVRFRGCGVGCVWCDTKYSWPHSGGAVFDDPQALAYKVAEISNGIKKITITGGEPLEQDWEALSRFIQYCSGLGFAHITMETAGVYNTLDFLKWVPFSKRGMVSFIVDYKLSSSKAKGEMDIPGHFARLTPLDTIKFVIGSEEDFDEAADKAAEIVATNWRTPRQSNAPIFFSPVHGKFPPHELANKVLSDPRCIVAGVGINLQMHKYLFPDSFRDEEDFGIDWTKRTLGRDEDLARKKSGDEQNKEG